MVDVHAWYLAGAAGLGTAAISKFSFFPLVAFLHCVFGVVWQVKSDEFFPFLDAVSGEVKVEKATESLVEPSLQLEVPTATQVKLSAEVQALSLAVKASVAADVAFLQLLDDIAKHVASLAVVHPVLAFANAIDVSWLVVVFLQLVAAATATQVLSALLVHAFLPAVTHYLKVSVLMQDASVLSAHPASVVVFLAFAVVIDTALYGELVSLH